jgi:hypothetical protein
MIRTRNLRQRTFLKDVVFFAFLFLFHGVKLLCEISVLRGASPSLVLAFDTPVGGRLGYSINHQHRTRRRDSGWVSLREGTLLEAETVLSSKDVHALRQLVERRSRARWEGDYQQADNLRTQLQKFPLPVGYSIWLEDIPRNVGGGTNWKLVFLDEEFQEQHARPDGPTILQLAHAALGLAVESSIQANLDRAKLAMAPLELSHPLRSVDRAIGQENAEDQKKRLSTLVLQAKDRLRQLSCAALQYELGGRKAADAAFWFALAGVEDQDLYQELVQIATDELGRFGERSSCRRKDIFQIVERFAAAGILYHDPLIHVVTRCLSVKSLEQQLERVDDNGIEAQNDSVSSSLTSYHHSKDDVPLLKFHSDRSLLIIWKFSTKQRKQRAFLQSAVKHWEVLKRKSSATTTVNVNKSADMAKKSLHAAVQDQSELDWNQMFDDPTRPLVVDIGCGMGVSLLGLATCEETKDGDYSSQVLSSFPASNEGTQQLHWPDCNFVGVDLGGLGIGYAQGLASRWGVKGRLQFVVNSAETFVTMVQNSYPGPIPLCLIQFPTPYRLDVEERKGESLEDNGETISHVGGNSQLPESPQDGFMVSQNLLSLVHGMLIESRGKLLLQSNCEDVAVWMRKTACNNSNIDQGGKFVYADEAYAPAWLPDQDIVPRIPQRTADWISMGGERAEGPGWFKDPILPRRGATETEVACLLNGTPVHRCVLVPRDVDKRL